MAVAGKKRRELNRKARQERKDKEGKTTEVAESAEKREERTAGSKRGRNDQRKIRQNPYRIRFFQGFPRRGTVGVVSSFPAPLHCVTPPSAPPLAGFMTGLKARGKLARDDGLLWYVAGFFMRWEYKEMERGCRSPGARERVTSYVFRVPSCQPSAKKKGTAEHAKSEPPRRQGREEGAWGQWQ